MVQGRGYLGYRRAQGCLHHSLQSESPRSCGSCTFLWFLFRKRFLSLESLDCAENKTRRLLRCCGEKLRMVLRQKASQRHCYLKILLFTSSPEWSDSDTPYQSFISSRWKGQQGRSVMKDLQIRDVRNPLYKNKRNVPATFSNVAATLVLFF